MRPKLRPLEVRPVTHEGRQSFLLQDPLHLTVGPLLLPAEWGPLLALCDGTRDLSGLRAALAVRTGRLMAEEKLAALVAQLDEALLLEGSRAEAALAEALRRYRSAPYRAPASAGGAYPAEPEALRELLEGYLAATPSPASTEAAWRGLVSPHIDYARGGAVYAGVWGAAAQAVSQADLVIIFGTDHAGSPGRLTLTTQQYATPWGLLPTEMGVVQAVAEALGPEVAFAEELHHRHEHAIELAAVWLHYLAGKRPPGLVPVLCGSFAPFVAGERVAAQDPALNACLAALTEATAGRQVLVVAAADLAHVGPAFGDPTPLGWAERARLQAADEALLAALEAGDAEAFLAAIADEGDRRRVCGLPPIYMALRFLGQSQGVRAGYALCPADAQGGSLVSVCGALLR
ncbi:MAG: AmmeMemoRadiSam system protein B [Chloroflexi bacterium]|nr:AmmeMemoRadiSam system protein B [Chloroflexota bacterium]